MGWLLTNRKNSKQGGGRTKKGGGTRGGSATPPPSGPGRRRALLKLLAGGVALACLAAVWGYGEQALEGYARRHHPAEITREDVTLAAAPDWMSRAVRLRLASVAAASIGSDPLDGSGLRRAAKKLDEVAWVKRVGQVRRVRGGKVEIRAAYRRPVAVVQARDGYHLVDAQAVRLPGLYFRRQVDRLHLPLVTGVGTAPPGRPGQKWRGRELPAALSLIGVLRDEPFFRHIEAFDVSRRDARGRLRLVLLTKEGMVVWGLPPGRGQAIEPDTQTKVARLERVASTRGSIDAGGRVVDIYGGSIELSQPALNSGGRDGYTSVR